MNANCDGENFHSDARTLLSGKNDKPRTGFGTLRHCPVYWIEKLPPRAFLVELGISLGRNYSARESEFGWSDILVPLKGILISIAKLIKLLSQSSANFSLSITHEIKLFSCVNHNVASAAERRYTIKRLRERVKGYITWFLIFRFSIKRVRSVRQYTRRLMPQNIKHGWCTKFTAI